MKNRIGKTIVTLLAVLALLTGIMPFGSRKVNAEEKKVAKGVEFAIGDLIDYDGKYIHNGSTTDQLWGSYTIEEGRYDNGQWIVNTKKEGSFSFFFSSEDFKGTEKVNGIKCVSGEGSSDNPFRFELLYEPGSDPIVEYPLRVGGNRVTSKYLADEGWNYDPDSRTLTLNKADIAPGGSIAGIYFSDRSLDLTIALAGESTVTGSSDGYAILSDGSLTIVGNGKLTLYAGNTGIYSIGTLTVKDKADLTLESPQGIGAASVNISGSTVTATASGSYGIKASKSLEITNSTVSSTGTPVFGLMASSAKISGSNVTATASGSGSIGIYTGGSLEITDSKVNAAGNYHGMQASSAKISGSNVTATASGSDSYGIYASSGSLEITDSTVNATGGERGLLTYSAKISDSTVTAAGSSLYGIDVHGIMEIIDSTVEASGLEYGIFQSSGEKLLIKGESTVKAKSTSDSFGSNYAGIRAAKIELDGVDIVKPADGTINGEYIYGPNDSNPSKDVEIKPAKGNYAIASGADGTYTLDSNKDYVLTVKRSVNDHRCINHFESVKLDEQALTKDTDYTAEKGSTIITLKAAALNRLSEGDHKITVSFDDGKAETSLTVKAAPAPTPDPTPVTPYQIPKTGVE